MQSKEEAFEMLRRICDWRYGLDSRTYQEAFPEDKSVIRNAYELILCDSKTFNKPLVDCERCIHSEIETFRCQLNIVGKCDKFEPRS